MDNCFTKIRQPRVVETKLGRSKAWGMYLDGVITLDARLYGRKRLEIVIHEMLHHIDPHKSERAVRRESRALANLLWRLRYREVDL